MLEIESSLSKYSNKYDLENLQKFRIFRKSENLEEALEDLNYLFEEQ